LSIINLPINSLPVHKDAQLEIRVITTGV